MKNNFSVDIEIPKYLTWIWRHKLLLIISIVSLVYAISYWLYTPQLNSNPVQHIAIRGQFPYNKGLKLALQVSFSSKNPTCKQMAMAFFIFPAAKVDRSVELDVPVNQMAEDRYEAELNIDHFLPGFCEWEYAGMSYQFLGDRQSDTNQHALGPIPIKANRSTLACEYSNIPKTNLTHVYCRKAVPPFLDKAIQPTTELNFLWKKD
ncbi:MAG: hypothetical protein WC073_15040 [Sterolibacterium sp.]